MIHFPIIYLDEWSSRFLQQAHLIQCAVQDIPWTKNPPLKQLHTKLEQYNRNYINSIDLNRIYGYCCKIICL